MGGSLFTSFYSTPLFVQLVQGYTPTMAGLLQMPAGFCMALGSVIFGRLGDLGYRRSLIFTGFVMVAYSNFLTASGDANTPFWTYAMWIVLARVGVSCIFPNLNVTGLRALPSHLLVQGAGCINFIRQLGGAFGVNIIAITLQTRAQFHGDALTATQVEDNPVTLDFLERLRELLVQGGVTGAPEGAIDPTALQYLGQSIYAQAQMFAFRDTFLAISIVATFALIPILFIKSGSKDDRTAIQRARGGGGPRPAGAPAE
jgi:predicted MFS family arabinose efflux permease